MFFFISHENPPTKTYSRIDHTNPLLLLSIFCVAIFISVFLLQSNLTLLIFFPLQAILYAQHFNLESAFHFQWNDIISGVTKNEVIDIIISIKTSIAQLIHFEAVSAAIASKHSFELPIVEKVYRISRK